MRIILTGDSLLYGSHYYTLHRPHKKFLYYRIAPPPEKSLPKRQFTGKNPSRSGSRRAVRIFGRKLSAWERLFWGDTIIGHRPTTLQLSLHRRIDDPPSRTMLPQPPFEPPRWDASRNDPYGTPARGPLSPARTSLRSYIRKLVA